MLVDGFAVPAGTTTYDYVDVFTNPAFGSVSVTDANALRPAGSSWTVPGSVTANAAPAAGRVLLGNVQVRTDANVLVGPGDVDRPERHTLGTTATRWIQRPRPGGAAGVLGCAGRFEKPARRDLDTRGAI